MKVKIVAWHDDCASCKVRILSRQCQNCVGHCGIQSESSLTGAMEIWLNKPARNFGCGDIAELAVSGKALTLAAAIVFVIPVTLLLLPVTIFTFLELPEKLLYTVAGISLTVGLSVSVLCGRLCGRQRDWSKLFDLQLKPVEKRNEPLGCIPVRTVNNC